MKRRRFLAAIGAGGVGLSAGPLSRPEWASGQAASSATRPPNILVIIADDLGWNDVGYHGSEIRTPNLDRLAALGVRLERHYVYPTCSPTRAGLLTGCNPARFDILSPIADRSGAALPRDTATLAALLRTRGYSTALAGKWHLGLRPEVGPRKYGFDQSYGYLHGQLDQYSHLYKNGDRTWHRNDSFVDEEGHATDLIAAEATRIIEASGQRPFFLWVSFSVPHHPVQEEAKWEELYQQSIQDPSRRLYAAAVTHMDAAIGRIARALEASGQAENTLILFTSDNGAQQNYASKTEYGGKHGPNPTLGNNLPLRGWKGELHEGGVRVPAFVHWRGKLRPTTVQDRLSLLDWFPTFAGLAGAAVDPRWNVEGRNVWPLLSGNGANLSPPLFYWKTESDQGLLEGDWKLILPGETVGRSSAPELYDLASDPAEERNLAGSNPGRVDAMRRVLAGRLTATDRQGDPRKP